MSDILIQFLPVITAVCFFVWTTVAIRQRRTDVKKEHADAQEKLYQDFLAGLDDESRRELLENENQAEQDRCTERGRATAVDDPNPNGRPRR